MYSVYRVKQEKQQTYDGAFYSYKGLDRLQSPYSFEFCIDLLEVVKEAFE